MISSVCSLMKAGNIRQEGNFYIVKFHSTAFEDCSCYLKCFFQLITCIAGGASPGKGRMKLRWNPEPNTLVFTPTTVPVLNMVPIPDLE